ncbi:MAG: AAA family ATPase [Acidimicrobiales bacterium]
MEGKGALSVGTNGDPVGGLSWPEQGTGTTPPPQYRSRQRDEDRLTRKPSTTWDRIKVLVLLVGLWSVMVWTAMADNPILPFRDALREQLRSGIWLLALAALEVLRQVHYLMSEHSAGWHRFWTKRVFGRLDQRTERMNSWTRFRISRVVRWSITLVALAFVLGKAFDTSPVLALFQAPAKLVGALPMVFQFGLLFFVIIIQFVGMAWYAARQGIDIYFPDDIKTRFTDVWGQDNVLERVKENILFLENPDEIEAKGGHVPAGILLWGPPGTGKTLMAEAVAGETGKPYVFVDPGGMTSFGFGALAVKGVFRKLRKLSVRYGGVIVFFDEADSLGSRSMGGRGPVPAPTGATAWSTTPSCNGLSYLDPRTARTLLTATHGSSSSGSEPPRRVRDGFFMMGGGGGGGGMLQALLTELSGLKKPRGFMNRVVRRALGMRPKPPPKYRILVMMATNMPQALDEALLRPGRIDRIYKVGYPSKPGRVKTYEGYLSKVRHALTPEQIDKLATITPYATGATIKDVVNEALIQAIRNGREVITWRDVMRAKQLKDLGPPEDVEYIERERHAVAVHEACHAVTAAKVRRHLTIDIATIEKGGTYLGMVASIPPEDQFTRWRSEYESDIMVSLASLAGERLFFEGDNSSGVSGDLESATTVATLMEGYWGMGSSVASHGVTHEVGIGGGGRPGGPKGKDGKEKELLETGLGERIEEKLAELLERTRQLLEENRHVVLAVAHALEANKTLTGDDVIAIVEGIEGPLVDGRPYHTQEFREVAERYHAMALQAHGAHGSVDVPLPRFVVAQQPELVGGARDGAGFGPPPPEPNGGTRPGITE